MKILLRSTFVGQPADNREEFFRNFMELEQSRLGFDTKEDTTLWEFIKDFSATQNHVPEYMTIRNHFEHRVRKPEVADRLDQVRALPVLIRGDFRKRLEDKAHDFRVSKIKSLLQEANSINTTGLEVRDIRKRKTILEGPIDAVRYFIDQSHDIVAPTTGQRLSGEVTTDGDDAVDEYDRVKSDPRAGLGQMTGLHPMDNALKGAKAKELWIHAAFTGHLKSITLCNWLYNQAVYYGEDNLFFSLEMPYQQVRRYLNAIHTCHPKFTDVRMKYGIQRDPTLCTGISYSKIRDGELSDLEEWFFKEVVLPDFKDPANRYGGIHIEVANPDKDDFTITDLRSKAEVLHSKTPFRLLVVDHVLLMSSRNRYNSTTERLNEVVRDLKKMSMNFNRGEGMAVVGLFQLSREGLKRVEKLRHAGKDPLYSLFDLSYANECLAKGTLVPTQRGLIPIENVVVGDRVWSRAGEKEVLDTFDQGTQPVWKITTDRGSNVEVTGGHRVRVLVGPQSVAWRTVSDLEEGDILLVPSKTDLPFPDTDVAKEYLQRFNLPFSGITSVVRAQPTTYVAPMYDLEVGGDHEYLTGPLFSHNCERSADVITASYVNDDLEAQNMVMYQCLKSRDNKKFAHFYARVFYEWRRILAILDEIDALEEGDIEPDYVETTLEE